MVFATIVTGLLTMKNQNKQNAFSCFTVTFMLNFTIPILGIVLTIYYALILLPIAKKECAIHKVNSLDPVTNLNKFPITSRTMRAGDVNALTANADQVSRHKKLHLVKTLKTIQGPESINAIKKLRGDQDDEIRLLSFASFNKFEKDIMRRIKKIRQRVDAFPEEMNNWLDLAELHWELLYFNLVEGELEEFVVERINQYLEKAHLLTDDTSSSRILRLESKIALKKKDYISAEKTLSELQAIEGTSSKTIPYLVEIAYLKGDFNTCKRLFRENQEFVTDLKMAPIARFWIGER